MKINNLEVDGWGVWSGLELQALSPRVTVIFGANETGKTTLMQFIRSMFYQVSQGWGQRGCCLYPFI